MRGATFPSEMGFLTGVDGLSQLSVRTCGRRQRWCGSFPRANKARKAFAKLKNESAG